MATLTLLSPTDMTTFGTVNLIGSTFPANELVYFGNEFQFLGSISPSSTLVTAITIDTADAGYFTDMVFTNTNIPSVTMQGLFNSGNSVQLASLMETLLWSNDTLVGSAGNDGLIGYGGNDTLDGGAGTDKLLGLTGNDTYVLGSEATGVDTVVDTGGTDTITSTITRSLVSYSAIENLTLLGAANINGTGNALANAITGNNGANILDGGGGLDILRGLLGNDTYVLANANDTVVDSGGIDTITSTVTRSLASYAAIEKLTLLGATAINGTGNALANTLVGNGAANTLDGGAANDVLSGLGGNDVLIGNAGKDTMTGGAGNDVFRFAATAHSPVGANADVIVDFDDSGDDRIDLSAVFGPALTYRHNAAFTAAGQLRINDVAGADLLVEVNTGGSLAADMQIRLAATTLASMTASDFIL